MLIVGGYGCLVHVSRFWTATTLRQCAVDVALNYFLVSAGLLHTAPQGEGERDHFWAPEVDWLVNWSGSLLVVAVLHGLHPSYV
jgi:hypothetical protein